MLQGPGKPSRSFSSALGRCSGHTAPGAWPGGPIAALQQVQGLCTSEILNQLSRLRPGVVFWFFKSFSDFTLQPGLGTRGPGNVLAKSDCLPRASRVSLGTLRCQVWFFQLGELCIFFSSPSRCIHTHTHAHTVLPETK